MALMNGIFRGLKTKFRNTSSSDIEEQGEIKKSLDNNRTVSFENPKSERYTYMRGLAGQNYENFRPETQEEKDTLSPIGFFRIGERDDEAQKKISERINAAARLLGKESLSDEQKELVTRQAEQEQPITQDIPSTAIKKIKYNPKTQELYVTFQGSNKQYWYPRVPKEKCEELMDAPSKGEYFLRNIHDQYSVNYQLHKTHSPQANKIANKQIKNFYKKVRKSYRKGMKKGSMKGVLN